nr:MAG TPA: hypothetical protein [Caudoviricetes sp.]
MYPFRRRLPKPTERTRSLGGGSRLRFKFCERRA